MTYFPARLPVNDHTRELIEQIRRAAAPLAGTEITPFSEEKFALFHQTGSRVEYEADYFETRKRLCVFVSLMLWEDDALWREEVERVLRALAQEPTWALPAHVARDADAAARRETLDLFACETAQAVCETLSLLEGRIDEKIAAELRDQVYARVVAPYLKTRRRWGKNNWSAVCAGSILMALIEQFPEHLDEALPDLRASMEDFLSSYNPDGCCMEGPLYWEYGFGYFVYALDRLRAHENAKTNYFRSPKIGAMAGFGSDMFLSGSHVIPFADSPHTLSAHIGLMHFLSREYNRPGFSGAQACAFGGDVRYRFAPLMRDFFWYAPERDTCAARENGHTLYRDAAWYIQRRSGYAAACKGGSNGEPHNHNDLGSFILYDGGFVLDDPGWPEYDASYFGANRYSHVCASSAGHSVPIINGLHQAAGADRRAMLLTSARNEVAYDLSAAYDIKGLRFRRVLFFDDAGMTVRDCFSGAESVVERFITRIEPTLCDGHVMIGDWRIQADQPARVSVSTDTFHPRFRGFAVLETDDKEIETVYQIDFAFEKAPGEVRLRIERA